MSTPKEPIRLRQRKMSSGNVSLYLDIYIDGHRTYEYLRLYLIPEKSRKDKETNRQTLSLAEAIRAKRVVELRNGLYGFENRYRLDADFLEYFHQICVNRAATTNPTNWWSVYHYLEQYCRKGTKFRDITPEWLQGFKAFLFKSISQKRKRPLAQNTKVIYFSKIRACINQAYNDGIIPTNPLRSVEQIKEEDTERVYLTFEEVKAMAATDCYNPDLKRAFLFSCLTGLRRSDIRKMRWKEVTQQGEYTRIIFRQKKTKGQEYLDISPQAVQYLGERKGDNDLVFSRFSYSTYMLEQLRAWAQKSGVSKPITFHSARHTFAVLMLDLGEDLYTVQKLLGHKMIQTTQHYAHILDKKKQAAVARIPSINIPSNDDSHLQGSKDEN